MAIKKFIQLKDKNNIKLFPISSLEEKGGEIKGNVVVQGNVTNNEGKSLSTNDFTNEDKKKVNSIEPLNVISEYIERSKDEWLAGSQSRPIIFHYDDGSTTFYYLKTLATSIFSSDVIINYFGVDAIGFYTRYYELQINWTQCTYTLNELPNIKSASVSGNTLTLTKEDGTTVQFTPQGGSGGIEVVEEFPEFTEDDVTKLYRLQKEDPETGNPIVDNIHMINSEFKPAGDNSSNCNATKNGTQISNYTAFKGYFDTDLNELYGSDFTISTFTNIYTAYYPNIDGESVSAIRIGTKNAGEIRLTNLPEGIKKLKLIVGKYFSYNGSTGQKTYDENAILHITDGAGEVDDDFELEEEPTELEVNIDDASRIDLFAYGSNSSGRVFLYGFIVEGEARTVLEPQELATKQDVEDLSDSLEPRISQNEDDILDLQDYANAIDDDLQATKEYIGDIQIFNATRLPTPKFDYLNTILKYEGKLYQCIQIGDAQEKEYSFENVTGTSEITGVNWNDFARQVTNGFKDDFKLNSWEDGEEWVPATSMREGVEYRTNNLPDDDVVFFNDTRLNNITITNYVSNLIDSSIPCLNIDYLYLAYSYSESMIRFDDIDDIIDGRITNGSDKPQVYFTCNDPTGFDPVNVGAINYLEEKQILRDYTISKLFRNNGELKMGSSSASAYFAIRKTENIDLPITQVKINLKTWSNTKNGELSWEIYNYDSEDGDYDSQLFEASDNVQSVTVEIPEEYNADYIYLENDKPEEYGDYRLKIQSIIVQFGSVEYQWKEISGSGAVDSVNGQTGDVVLTAEDIALESEDKTIEEKLIENSTTIADLEETDEDLQDQITNLKSRGRYLSNWNSTTGLPMTNPTTELPYDYRAGDYFIVGTVDYANYNSDNTYNTGDKVKYNDVRYVALEDGITGEWDSTKWEETELVLYRPYGNSYTGVASTVEETEIVGLSDEYIYDGSQWVYQKNAPIDLSEYANKTLAETITANWTFNNELKIYNSNYGIHVQGVNLVFRANNNDFLLSVNGFKPTTNNNRDLGDSLRMWKDAYIAGKLYGATASANTDDICNGLLGMDAPSSTTLTDEEYNKFIKHGVVINETFLGNSKTVFFPNVDIGLDRRSGFYIASNNQFVDIGQYRISENKIISKQATNLYYVRLHNIQQLNEKTFPTYSKGALYYNGSTLEWKDIESLLYSHGLTLSDNTVTELDYDHITKLTLGLNTTFTLKAAPTSTGTNLSYSPEYKLELTTGAGSITLTFPTGTYKLLTNDSNISLSNNVLTVPANSEMEISIQNNRIVAMNWSL